MVVGYLRGVEGQGPGRATVRRCGVTTELMTAEPTHTQCVRFDVPIVAEPYSFCPQ